MSQTTARAEASAAPAQRILFLGATGFIGSAVLHALLASHWDASFTLYGRNCAALSAIASLASKGHAGSITTAVYALDDAALSEHVVASDAVVNCLGSEMPTLTSAILTSARHKFEATRQRLVYLHTSGCDVLDRVLRPGDLEAWDVDFGPPSKLTVYTDAAELPPGQSPLSAVPDTPRRAHDALIDEANAAGYVRCYTLLPSCVYGPASNPFAAAGHAARLSWQVPNLIRIALDRRAPALLGNNDAQWTWNHVHVDDLAALYALVFARALAGAEGPRHFIAENGYYTLREVADAIGREIAVRELGTATPSALSPEERRQYALELTYQTAVSRAVGSNARSAGWTPANDHAGFLASIAHDVAEVLCERERTS
ncbi:uncharacterized protein LOC62_04G005475 [Vanrija pseudolonga]|uniref:Saccharopine dehydrogenase NADP binding domain-containing protein n=1 Tax=Vanrija pseudolonga TaxID=143232 RepID=A0AAF0YDT1_9TREE|nr:hypothetical protein LOC62_04G005475 [Vanrija pseudolonga]